MVYFSDEIGFGILEGAAGVGGLEGTELAGRFDNFSSNTSASKDDTARLGQRRLFLLRRRIAPLASLTS